MKVLLTHSPGQAQRVLKGPQGSGAVCIRKGTPRSVFIPSRTTRQARLGKGFIQPEPSRVPRSFGIRCLLDCEVLKTTSQSPP